MHSKNRTGSIPLVLLVVTVLGIGAAASMFMTSSTARIDKHSELNTQAWSMAQSAVEEVLVRLTNGSASWDAKATSRFEYEPKATLAVAAAIAETRGITIDVGKVQIMGRLAEKQKGDAEERSKFMAYLRAGTNFGNSTVFQGKGYDVNSGRWYEHFLANGPLWKNSPALQGVREAFEIEPGHQGDMEEYFQYVKEYATKKDNPDSIDGATAKEVARTFNDLQPLPDPGDWTNVPLEAQVAAAPGRIGDFVQRWNLAMDAVADRVDDRIANCDGNKNYGFGAMLGSFSLGAGPKADADEEEDLRETGEAGGVLRYNASLVTVNANVTASTGGVASKQTVTAHRLVASTNSKEAGAISRDQTLLHLMYFYHFTPGDFVYIQENPDQFEVTLPMVNVQTSGGDGKTGTVTSIRAADGLWTKNMERHNDLGGVRVMPFQAATCLAKTKGA